MKIVYLNPSGQLGGAEVSLLDMLASLRAARAEWSLSLVISEDGPLRARAEALGVQTIVLAFPRSLARLGDASLGGTAGNSRRRLALYGELLAAAPAVALYVRRLRRLLRQLAPNIIHTNGLKMHLLGVRANAERVPVVWHMHDYLSLRPVMRVSFVVTPNTALRPSPIPEASRLTSRRSAARV